eukprot:766400-Hanusia_phi.AAC.7
MEVKASTRAETGASVLAQLKPGSVPPIEGCVGLRRVVTKDLQGSLSRLPQNNIGQKQKASIDKCKNLAYSYEGTGGIVCKTKKKEETKTHLKHREAQLPATWRGGKKNMKEMTRKIDEKKSINEVEQTGRRCE